MELFSYSSYLIVIMQFSTTMTNTTGFSNRSIRRLIKNHTDKRVTEDAVLEMADALDDLGQKLTESAHSFADHAARKTIHAKDVRKAVRY